MCGGCRSDFGMTLSVLHRRHSKFVCALQHEGYRKYIKKKIGACPIIQVQRYMTDKGIHKGLYHSLNRIFIHFNLHTFLFVNVKETKLDMITETPAVLTSYSIFICLLQ